jgi:hypothetical protein
MSEAVLHIGLPKTGTSYVQESLVQHRETLAASGVDVLNVAGRSQHHAAWDLLGRRIGGADATAVEGAWADLAGRAARSPHDRVILSDEFLVHARPADVRTMVRTLAPRELRVVVTVRDLGRAVTSMWEQNTAKGRTIQWSDYVAAVRDPSSGPPTSGVAFWLRYDVRRILASWAESVDAENLRVVVVPRPGSPAPLLMERFANAAGLDLSDSRTLRRQVHASPGTVQVEVLRRMNAELRDRLSEAQYLRVVADLYRPASAHLPPGPGIAFPAEHRAWLEQTSTELIDWLATSSYAVFGDLDDLRPAPEDTSEISPDELPEDVIDTATRQLLLATLTTYGSGTGARRKRRKNQAGTAGSQQRSSWASRLRALGFRARVKALERADRNRFLARLANLYLRRTRRPG